MNVENRTESPGSTLLLVPELPELFRVEKSGEGVQMAQEAADGSVQDGGVGVERVGVVSFGHLIDAAESFERGRNFLVLGFGG